LEGRVNTSNISVGHVSGDPRSPAHLRSRLRLAAFSSAIVLCDVSWTDPDPYDGVDEIDRCLFKNVLRIADPLSFTKSVLLPLVWPGAGRTLKHHSAAELWMPSNFRETSHQCCTLAG